MTAAEILCEIVLGALSAAWLIAGANRIARARLG
jgi:hypothetical protein